MSTILVIDDIATNRDVLVTLLGYYGHHLLEARDGVEGLRIARAERPDLIIADILMPTMDGYEFVRQLRLERQISGTTVVFYTAHYLEKEARELAASCSVFHIIAKPSDPRDVIRVVEEALNSGATAGNANPADSNPGDNSNPGGNANPTGNARSTGNPGVPQEFNREHVRLLTDKLAEQSEKLHNSNLRLNALILLGQQLASEQNPSALVQGYCGGARRIVGAAFAGIWFSATSDQVAGEIHFSGIDSAAGEKLTLKWRDHPDILESLATRTPRHLVCNACGDEVENSNSLPFVCMMAIPVFSGPHTYGWLGLWNKLGGDDFSKEEEDLASTICAKLAVRYENTLLYQKIQQANQTLEARVEERTRELAQANAELSRSNSELEQYAYSASHDLQEPLRMVSIYAELLRQQYRGRFDEQGEMFLDMLLSGAGRMRTLVDDLLNYSTLVMASGASGFEVVDLQAMVESARENCSVNIADAGAVVLCEPLTVVRGRPDQLRQVFQNLIANAVRYRKPDVSPVIRIAGSPTDTAYVVTVADNGIGLDMKFAEHIFGLFKRLHNNSIPGTGIGLAICKRAVENHGGRIWVESIPGEGSIFSFALPSALLMKEQVSSKR